MPRQGRFSAIIGRQEGRGIAEVKTPLPSPGVVSWWVSRARCNEHAKRALVWVVLVAGSVGLTAPFLPLHRWMVANRGAWKGFAFHTLAGIILLGACAAHWKAARRRDGAGNLPWVEHVTREMNERPRYPRAQVATALGVCGFANAAVFAGICLGGAASPAAEVLWGCAATVLSIAIPAWASSPGLDKCDTRARHARRANAENTILQRQVQELRETLDDAATALKTASTRARQAEEERDVMARRLEKAEGEADSPCPCGTPDGLHAKGCKNEETMRVGIALARRFGAVSFSVRCAGDASVVSWENGPPEEEVREALGGAQGVALSRKISAK